MLATRHVYQLLYETEQK